MLVAYPPPAPPPPHLSTFAGTSRAPTALQTPSRWALQHLLGKTQRLLNCAARHAPLRWPIRCGEWHQRVAGLACMRGLVPLLAMHTMHCTALQRAASNRQPGVMPRSCAVPYSQALQLQTCVASSCVCHLRLCLILSVRQRHLSVAALIRLLLPGPAATFRIAGAGRTPPKPALAAPKQ